MSNNIKTRIKQRFATYSDWTAVWETFKPLKGEVCIFDIPSGTTIDGNTVGERTLLQKVGDSTNGTDGTTLKNLPWQSVTKALSAIKADKLTTSRTITLSGVVNGDTVFDGTDNVTISTTATKASTETAGIVKLNDNINSSSKEEAATANAVKQVADAKSDKGHTHTKSNITDFEHTHDDRYYTESEVDVLLSAKSDDHKHPYLPDSTVYAKGAKQNGAAVSANKVNKSLTFKSDGSGANSGSTFDGSTAQTISYNTIGAAPTAHSHTTSIQAATSGATSKLTLAHGTTYTLTAGDDTFVFTMPTDNNTHYTADRGVVAENGTYKLSETFYNYLLKETFATPTISSFSLSGTNTSGSKVVGTTVTLNSISYATTNSDNISGNLTLSRATGAGVTGRTLSSTISKTGTSASISDTFTGTNNGTVTYTLSAPYTDTTGANKTVTKTASVSFYWPVYKFASSSTTPSVSGQTYSNTSSVKGAQSITTTATNKHVHFITTETITDITSGGFVVPFTSRTLSITINGCSRTYNAYTIPSCPAGSNNFVLA